MNGRRNTNQAKAEAVRGGHGGGRGGNLDTRERNVGAWSKESGDFGRMERDYYGTGNFRRVQEAYVRSGQEATCSEAEMGWPGAPRRLGPKSGQTGFTSNCRTRSGDEYEGQKMVTADGCTSLQFASIEELQRLTSDEHGWASRVRDLDPVLSNNN